MSSTDVQEIQISNVNQEMTQYFSKQISKANQEMALYFSQHVSTKQIVKWAINSLFVLQHSFEKQTSYELDTGTFIENFSLQLIPGLLDCSTKDEQIEVLTNELEGVIAFDIYERTKRYLITISEAYLYYYKKFKQDESYFEDVNTTTHLMHMLEIYGTRH